MITTIKTELVFDEERIEIKADEFSTDADQTFAFEQGARYQYSIDKAAHDKIVGELQEKLLKFEGMTFSENEKIAQLKSDLKIAVELIKGARTGLRYALEDTTDEYYANKILDIDVAISKIETKV